MEENNLEIKGSRTCKECGGSGKVRGKKGRMVRCRDCEGTGTIYLVDCPDCRGFGVASDRSPCRTCCGLKIIPKVEAKKILDAQKSCAKLKENPMGALVVPGICVAVIAFCIRPVITYAFVDIQLFFGSMATFWGLPVLVAFCMICHYCSEYFKGSVHDPNKNAIRAIGLIILFAGVMSAVLSGLTTDKYGWIEGKAKDAINGRYLQSQPVKCLHVDVTRNVSDTYFGKAKLSNGELKPVVVTYRNEGTTRSRHRAVKYSISVQF